MTDTPRTALLAGASRGLGLGLARELLGRGWSVIATARAESPGLTALQAESSGRLRIETVDIDLDDQVAALKERLTGVALDLLFVVAGIGGPDPEVALNQVSREDFCRIMLTNAYSPIVFSDALQDLVRADGIIAYMTSGLGSITRNTEGGYDAYRASKAALNMLGRSAVLRYGAGRTLLLLHPGWVRTDMGGPAAPLDVETSVRGLATVIESHHGKPGQANLDYAGNTLPW